MSLATILLRCALASFVTSLVFVAAMPSFDGIASWSSVGDLVPGLTHLEGLGPSSTHGTANHVPFYLSIGAARGNPGNVTMFRNKSPPLFYIHQNQLWHYHNDSTILPVNVHNISSTSASPGSAQLPLQMIVGPTPDGVPGGRWRWQATMLFYENGAQNNQGLFYSCAGVNGLNGMFLFLQCVDRVVTEKNAATSGFCDAINFTPLADILCGSFFDSSAPPPGCTPFTVHSFNSNRMA